MSGQCVTCQVNIHCESKKTCHYTSVCNFAKYWPIFKILSLTDSVANSPIMTDVLPTVLGRQQTVKQLQWAPTGSVSGEQWSILRCEVLMSPRMTTRLNHIGHQTSTSAFLPYFVQSSRYSRIFCFWAYLHNYTLDFLTIFCDCYWVSSLKLCRAVKIYLD